jgi:hypothetical protein
MNEIGMGNFTKKETRDLSSNDRGWWRGATGESRFLDPCVPMPSEKYKKNSLINSTLRSCFLMFSSMFFREKLMAVVNPLELLVVTPGRRTVVLLLPSHQPASLLSMESLTATI